MADLRYERVIDVDSAAFVDNTNVYNPEQIDDSATIITRTNDFDTSFDEKIGFRHLFQDQRLSKKQQRICSAIVIATTCISFLIVISLFVGFGKVLTDIIRKEESMRHGLMMIPNLRSRPLNVFYYNAINRSANSEYANEIDRYLKRYREYQQKLQAYLKDCTILEYSMQKSEQRWCRFDVDGHFGPDCTKASNYGYDSGSPCILFVFEDRQNWSPHFTKNVTHLAFLCRMQYQYSSTIRVNMTYYPPLAPASKYGGFMVNMLPNLKITSNTSSEILAEDGDLMYNLPPILMVKLDLSSSMGRHQNNSPFTLDCRIKDNVFDYEFSNLRDFKGQTAISFDFVLSSP